MISAILMIFGVLLLIVLLRLLWKYYRDAQPAHLRSTPAEHRADDNAVTIFIPGYAGNRFSFGGMLNRFVTNRIANKSLVIFIDRHNHLSVRGHFDAYRPMVQLIFRSPRSSVRRQAAGVMAVVQYLHQHNQVQTLNLVAHSMGGVVLFQYLTQASRQRNLPEVQKVITMGAPFNDTEVGVNTHPIENHQLTQAGPEETTPVYNYFLRTLSQLPNSIYYLNIAGNLGDNPRSDGAVALNSALSLRFLLRDAVDRYQEFIVSGRGATHYRLHENHLVDQQVSQFLWREQ